MLATIFILFGVAAASGVMLFDEEQTIEEKGDDSPEAQPVDGADDILDLIARPNTADEMMDDTALSSDVSFRFDENSIESASEPLDDWTQSKDILILGGDQTLFLEFSENLNGSLFTMDANYAETIQPSENGSIQTHIGKNVYFVPEDEIFPPDYEWSIEGNSLYNSETHVDDSNAFGGIKLVVRLEGGWFLNSPNGTLLQDQTYQTPTLISNLRPS
jgi:hypothetical protein